MSRPRWPSGWIVAAALLAAAVLVLSVYRAATQSITHDEAHTYNMFVSGPISNAFRFTANNHVLHTWLARLSVGCLGSSGFTLRVPALLGTVFYLVALLAMVHLTFPRGRWVLIAVALACLNPLLMDFFACARGYSLALGLLMCALLCLMRCACRDGSCGSSWKAGALGGVLIGLSVAASFPFAFPAAAAGAFFLLTIRRESAAEAATAPAGTGSGNSLPLGRASRNDPLQPGPQQPATASPATVTLRHIVVFGLCGAVVVAAAIVPYLGRMRKGRISAGYHSWKESATDILNASFLSPETARLDIPSGSSAQFPEPAVIAFVATVSAVLLIVTILAGTRLLRRDAGAPSLTSRGALMFSGAAFLSGVFYVVCHALIGLKYPVDRVVLYLVPLTTLGVLLGLLAWGRRPRLLEWAVLVMCLAVIGRYATELHVTYFRTWGYDADSREVFLRMEQTAPDHRLEPVRVGGDWHYEPSMNFYRQTRHADWMRPFTRVMDQPRESYDFLLYSRTESDTFDAKGFEVLLRGSISGIVLYGNQSAPGRQVP